MIKRAYSRDLLRTTQVIENSDGTFTPTVAVTGSIITTKSISNVSSAPANSLQSDRVSIKKACEIHSFSIFMPGDDPDYSIRISFWNGDDWEDYRLLTSNSNRSSDIRPSNAENAPFLSVDGNLIYFNKTLKIKGIKIDLRNATENSVPFGTNIVYSEVSN